MAKVALVYNLIPIAYLKEGRLDLIAEYDTENTIRALKAALESSGHTVLPLEADESIAEKLRTTRPDIVFNIAEGLRGESRESHVPMLCEMLNIPYTGSGPLTLAICLNKARTKEILTCYGVPTPPFQVFYAVDDALSTRLEFPLIVKLLHEGSSMGLSNNSVVDDEPALRRQVEYLQHLYKQPVIVEQFIDGREFTVGLLGNHRPHPLPIIEVLFDQPRGITLFELDEDVIPLLQKTMGAGFSIDRQYLQHHHWSVCPAEVDDHLAARIAQTAVQAFRALDCHDWCRMEMRLGAGRDNQVYVLEVNPIAGITPGYWLPRAAEAAGLDYATMVNAILNSALERYSINP